MENTFTSLRKLPDDIVAVRYYQRFCFTGFVNESFCTILIVRKRNKGLVVVCSQIPGNVGTSITNGIEAIATQLYKEIPKEWGKEEPLWLEHYPIGTGMLDSRYTLMQVTYEIGGPSWGPLLSWKQAARLSAVKEEILAHGFETEIN